MEPERFKISDILYGFVIPMILVLLIFVLAVYVNPNGEYHVFGNSTGLGTTVAVILTQGFAQMIILGIPLILGLTWNKWAGGAAGFIMGGMYYLAVAGTSTGSYLSYAIRYSNPDLTYNFFGDMAMLFYLVNAVIIGYMAGALNGGSTNFKRMLGAGLVASLTTTIIQLFMNNQYALSPSRQMSIDLWAGPLGYAVFISFLPSIALGIIVPILAKVMSWYGLSARKQY
ncbi:MAG: hypothetical protein FWB84_00055 [Candidatus Bathyarchaeota archaeon]|uniref:hypothetical protein n=1 Tax=Candidatus Bathycorpusculum sp. TaxID=2994959 RepID=UPI00281834AA|nr:hypothetical protein [Candidatus Termiticorpusculum sp.]MCL2256598.1 hypothetical protein [Candidatus Termiticorpusculum sp.]MCL2293220.1 hypothetical protein [Candidatus Termiticorpusculum sp.]